LLLILMVVLIRLDTSSYGKSIGGTDTSFPKKTIVPYRPAPTREAVSIIVLIAAVSIGFVLTFNSFMADMKLSEALRVWPKDANEAVSLLTEAVSYEPGEPVYYGYLGSYTFYMATRVDDPVEKSKQLAFSISAYNNAARSAPYLAYWSHRLADVYSYWANHGAADKQAAAIAMYERADTQLPNNPVVLNKWALQLMMKGDMDQAEVKLLQSAKSDPAWVQTSFYHGLLQVYKGQVETSGNSWVAPVVKRFGTINYYINFCKQATYNGGIDHIVDGMRSYVEDNKEDWVGYSLLGVAALFDDRMEEGTQALTLSSELAPSENIMQLKSIVGVMSYECKDFKNEALDILVRLDNRISGEKNAGR